MAKRNIISQCCFCHQGLNKMPYAAIRIGEECYKDLCQHRIKNLKTMSDIDTLPLIDPKGNKVRYRQELIDSITEQEKEKFELEYQKTDFQETMERRDELLKKMRPFLVVYSKMYAIYDRISKDSNVYLSDKNKKQTNNLIDNFISLAHDKILDLKNKELLKRRPNEDFLNLMEKEEENLEEVSSQIKRIIL